MADHSLATKAGSSSSAGDEVTFFILKDNFAARTFRLPTAWLTQLGAILGVLAALTLVSGFFAVKYRRIATRSDPSRVQALEKEIGDLREKISTQSAQLATAQSQAPAPTASSVASAAPLVAAPAPMPVPTVTVTVKVPSDEPAPRPGVGGSPLLFQALPANIEPIPADPNKIAIGVQSPKVTWAGKKLQVSFNIQYVRTDGGSQQGRIVVLARGPETLLAYPEGALNVGGEASLIAPDQGEYFSVSRFREVQAEFVPSGSHESIRFVQVLLFSQSGQLLFDQRIEPTKKPAAPAAPKPEPKAPAPTSDGGSSASSAVNGSGAAPAQPKPAPKAPARNSNAGPKTKSADPDEYVPEDSAQPAREPQSETAPSAESKPAETSGDAPSP